MKKAIVIAWAMVVSMTAWAYDYPYLTLQTADGTETSVATDQLVLTVDDTQLVVTNADGTKTFALASLSKMYFSTTPSDISTTMASMSGVDASVEVYTTGGILVGRYDSTAEAKSRLRGGVYVMKTNDRTFKTVVK